MSKQSFKYKTKFVQPIIASCDLDEETYRVSIASSLDELKKIIPSSINLERNIDLSAVAFNGAVVNKFNKNHDGIDSESAVAIKDYFVHKPTNIEHKKQRIVGHIVSAGFSEYATNNILSDEEARNLKVPYNLAFGAVVYRMVDRDFANLIAESADQESSYYKQISASWEIGFNDYQIALGSEDLSQAELITDSSQVREFSKYLRANEGTGEMDDGTLVRRLIVGQIYPLGIGYTSKPAADVEGIVIKENDARPEIEEKDDQIDVESAKLILKNILNFKKSISQKGKNNVNSKKGITMDSKTLIQEIKSVLDEKLSSEKFSDESVANISDIINDAILQKNEEYKADLSKAQEEKALIEAEQNELKASVDDLSHKLQKAQEKIDEFESAQKAQEALARFNARMEQVEQDYELEEADLKIVAKEVQELDVNDEAFASYQEKLAVVFKHKNKEFIAEQNKKFDQAVSEAVEKRVQEIKESKASDDNPEGDEPAAEANEAEAAPDTEEQKDLEESLEQAEETSPEISNVNEASSGETETLKTKFQSAFSRDNINVTY